MKWLFFLIAIILPGMMYSQNKIHGVISENTTWSGVITLDGDVTIPRGVTLTIDPGSRILCSPKTDKTSGGIDPERIELIVQGTLQAKGTGSDGQIVFTSNASDPQMNDWYGIIIKNRKTPSEINHSVVEYGYKGITCYGSSPVINGCEVRFNYYIGISCEVRAKPRISNSIILGNGFAGISCELAASPVVENTVITQNTNGVIVFDRSRVDLGHVPLNPDESRGENRIFNNFEIDIYNRSTNEIFAQNNIWNVANLSDIQGKIFDQNDNPTYGRVTIEPIYVPGNSPLASKTPPSPQQSSPPTAQEKKPVNPVASKTEPGKTFTTPRKNRQSTTETSPPLAVNSKVGVPPGSVKIPPKNSLVKRNSPKRNPNGRQTETSPSAPAKTTPPQPGGQQNSSVTSTTPPPRTKTQPVPRTPNTRPSSPKNQPIIEALLDSGRRHYINRAIPKYPEIYLRTHHEGKVLMEVIVNEKGEVENYRVLSSDGEYFTLAAVDAIKQMRYKPETFQGQPTKFKIVEPFIFKLE